MTLLLLLVAFSRHPQPRSDAFLYPGGRERFSLGRHYRRLRDGTRLDCALEARYWWTMAHRGIDRRFERHGRR